MEHNRQEASGTEQIRQMFANSADVHVDKYALGKQGHERIVYLIYAEGLADTKPINQYVLPRLENIVAAEDSATEQGPVHMDWKPIGGLDEIPDKVFNGMLVIYFEDSGDLFALDVASPPHRSPQDTNTEISIKGPRDGFVEEAVANIALIRKRLRTQSLSCESFTIGKRSRSYVALLYIQDIANPALIDEVKRRLQRIDIDALLGAGQLEMMLADESASLFPLLDYSGRPDFTADCLVLGRFALLVDGSPLAIIAPTNLTMLLKSPEDLHFPFYFASMGVMLRLFGLVTSLLLPGFWVALSAYNMEQIPYPLLATIALSRIGLPFPGPLEAFMMVGMFELFREAGERLPKAVGQTVAVVGGIIVGDAAIRAGLASPTLLVVTSITAVASFTLVNQSLFGTVSVLRFLVLLCSSVLGMYGFILSVIAILLYMAKLKSFGIPYLAPLSPFNPKDILAALLRKPWYAVRKRPDILQTTDKTRRGGRS